MRQFLAGCVVGALLTAVGAAALSAGSARDAATPDHATKADMARIEALVRRAIDDHKSETAPTEVGAQRSAAEPIREESVQHAITAESPELRADGTRPQADELSRLFTMFWRCSRDDSLGVAATLDAHGFSPFDPRFTTITEEAYRQLSQLRSRLLDEVMKVRKSVGLQDASDGSQPQSVDHERFKAMVQESKKLTQPLDDTYTMQSRELLEEFGRRLDALR